MDLIDELEYVGFSIFCENCDAEIEVTPLKKQVLNSDHTFEYEIPNRIKCPECGTLHDVTWAFFRNNEINEVLAIPVGIEVIDGK